MLSRLKALFGRRRSVAPPEPFEPPEDALQEHVRYAMGLAASYLGQLEQAGCSLRGLRVLELGPGSDFGPALILASHGAKVTIADRFMDKQDQDHHRALNARLLQTWDGPNQAIRRAVEVGGYDGVLTLLDCDAENLACPDRSFDLVLSNAVFEHVVGAQAACRQLFRVTAVGGAHFHQIDLRDHRDFARPLEYLLSNTDDFEPSAQWPGQYGSRRRQRDYARLFLDAGFIIETETTNGVAEAAYLEDFIARLLASASPYRDVDRADLSKLGALFHLSRPSPPSDL